MRHVILVLCFWLSISTALAQFHEKLQGKPFDVETNKVNQGESLFLDGWYKGYVKLKSGEVLDGISIRYDKINDQLLYEENEQYYIAGPSVVQFHIASDDALYNFSKGYPKIGKNTENSFYEVLHDGTTKLLKKHTATLKSIKNEEGTLEKVAEDATQYYVIKDKKIVLLKEPFEQSLLTILADKRSLMKMVIVEQQLEFNEDIDIVSLLEEYDAYKAGSPGH
jgi:hypothetical protein